MCILAPSCVVLCSLDTQTILEYYRISCCRASKRLLLLDYDGTLSPGGGGFRPAGPLPTDPEHPARPVRRHRERGVHHLGAGARRAAAVVLLRGETLKGCLTWIEKWAWSCWGGE